MAWKMEGSMIWRLLTRLSEPRLIKYKVHRLRELPCLPRSKREIRAIPVGFKMLFSSFFHASYYPLKL